MHFIVFVLLSWILIFGRWSPFDLEVRCSWAFSHLCRRWWWKGRDREWKVSSQVMGGCRVAFARLTAQIRDLFFITVMNKASRQSLSMGFNEGHQIEDPKCVPHHKVCILHCTIPTKNTFIVSSSHFFPTTQATYIHKLEWANSSSPLCTYCIFLHCYWIYNSIV